MFLIFSIMMKLDIFRTKKLWLSGKISSVNSKYLFLLFLEKLSKFSITKLKKNKKKNLHIICWKHTKKNWICALFSKESTNWTNNTPLLHQTQWMVGKTLHTMSLLKAILLVKQVHQHTHGWMDGWLVNGWEVNYHQSMLFYRL
jgi:hypothetical protein